VAPFNEHNARYLATKRDKLGHQIPAAGTTPPAASARDGIAVADDAR
jgi:hypothetical protein